MTSDPHRPLFFIAYAAYIIDSDGLSSQSSSMGLFFSDPIKPRVSRLEWPKVRTSLFDRGFNKKEIDWVESFFQGDLNELAAKDVGIQGDEIERGIGWMRANMGKHKLSDAKVSLLEGALRAKL
jgi:hypothetical protein